MVIKCALLNGVGREPNSTSTGGSSWDEQGRNSTAWDREGCGYRVCAAHWGGHRATQHTAPQLEVAQLRRKEAV